MNEDFPMIAPVVGILGVIVGVLLRAIFWSEQPQTQAIKLALSLIYERLIEIRSFRRGRTALAYICACRWSG